MSAFAKGGRPRSPVPTGACPPLGIYVHFPWCVRKCPYCDFLSLPIDPQQIPHASYLQRLVEELEARTLELDGERYVRSIFIGGGTPSLWEPARIGALLEAIDRHFTLAASVEITVECNPSSFDRRRAAELAQVGVNRVSIGVQSLDPERLAFLGRWHSPAQALEAVRAACDSAIAQVSGDLIYGVHGQSPEAAVQEAESLAATGITHLSAYTLTIEKGTQFGARARQGKLPLLGEDSVADSFLQMHAALEALGFDHYEISNFARQGDYAVHNLGYWAGDDYLGLGAGAWGTITTGAGRIRYRNTPSPDRYLNPDLAFETLKRDHERALVQEVEPIDASTALSERLLLGLRLRRGVDVAAAAKALGAEAWPKARQRAAARLVERGRLHRQGDHLSIPADQWLLADDTIAALL